MALQRTKRTKQAREPKKQTPTFLLELPLVVTPAQAKRLRAHLEAGRQFYNALLALLNPRETIPSIAHGEWEGAELRLRAGMESLEQRANAGESFPQSFGIPGARARRLKSLGSPQQEQPSSSRGQKR